MCFCVPGTPIWGSWTCGWIERIVGGINLLCWFANQATVSMWNSTLYMFDSAYCMSWFCGESEKGLKGFLLSLASQSSGSRGNSCSGVHRRERHFRAKIQDSVPIYTHSSNPREKLDSYWLVHDCRFGYSSLNECFSSKSVCLKVTVMIAHISLLPGFKLRTSMCWKPVEV